MEATRYTYTTKPLVLAVTNLLKLVDDYGNITNTAFMSYDYATEYGKATLSDDADVVVSATVDVPKYVIDFGLPVTFNLDGNPLISGYETIVKAESRYGKVTFDGLSVTYTPNQVLPGADFIRLTIADEAGSTDNIGYGVRIYPATSVYYDESFLTYEGSWTHTTPSEKPTQTTTVLGGNSNGQNHYGFDSAYANNASMASCASSGTVGDMASFTFTGSGFQLYANSKAAENGNPGSGIVTVYSRGKLSKLYLINTILAPGNSALTQNQKAGTYYGLPIISETSLPWGEYTVQIKHTNNNNPIFIDGVRILNTIDESHLTEATASQSIYYADKEDRPVFYEVRDAVLKSVITDQTTSNYIADPKNPRDSRVEAVSQMAGQIYNANAAEASAVVFTSGTNITSDNAQDLLDNGPKNELYLYPGQTLVFNVKTDRVVQLGLKSPTGGAQFELFVNNTENDLSSISTPVDMFYMIAGPGGSEHTVSIKVISGLLSVTLLKICDDPNAGFAALTENDLEQALLNLYGLAEDDQPKDPVIPEDPTVPEGPTVPEDPTIPEEPTIPEDPTVPEDPTIPDEPDEPVVTYADAVLNVKFYDCWGRVLSRGTLSENGVAGEAAVFSASSILSAAALPGQYAFVDPSAVSDTSVAYGENSTVSVRIGKVASMKIKYVNIFGQTLGTETVSRIQSQIGLCCFDASEVTGRAPAGRTALWMIPVIMTYGSTYSFTVVVY